MGINPVEFCQHLGAFEILRTVSCDIKERENHRERKENVLAAVFFVIFFMYTPSLYLQCESLTMSQDRKKYPKIFLTIRL